MQRIVQLAILFLITQLTVTGFSQSQPDRPLRRDVFPPTPNAAAIQKFNDVPVNLSSGIPEISIPVYSYETNTKIPLKISLDYHAGGIKVNEISSDVGHGWALSEYKISRMVRGIPDDYKNKGYFYVGPLENSYQYIFSYRNSTDAADSAYQFFMGLLDSQSDVFSYNINGVSGKFYFSTDGQYLVAPQANIKIERIFDPNLNYYTTLKGFLITDEEGVKYYFTENEDIFSDIWGDATPAGFKFSSAWSLSKIVSPFRTDSIQFTYDKAYVEYDEGWNEVAYDILKTDGFISPTYGAPDGDRIQTSVGKYKGYVNRVTRITCPDGTSLQFNYQAYPRKDITSPGSLAEIKITAQDSVSSYKFWQSYSGGTAYNAPTLVSSALRLQLDSISLHRGNRYENSYVFTYDGSLPDRLSKGIDHWGYYTNTGSSWLFPRKYLTPDLVLDGAFREANFTFGKRGSLIRIKYPTGGSVEYQYEGNVAGDGKLQYKKVKKDAVNVIYQEEASKFFVVDRLFTDVPIRFYFKMNGWCPDVPLSCQFIYKIKSQDGSHLYASQSLGYYQSSTWVEFDNFQNGTYLLEWSTSPSTGCTCMDNLGFELSWNKFVIDSTQLVGGIRLKSSILYDGFDHANDIITNYSYLKSDGTSSGTVRWAPKYEYEYTEKLSGSSGINVCFYDNHQYLVRTSEAYSLGSTPVIYSRVVTSVGGGAAGKTVHEFTSYNDSGEVECYNAGVGNCFPFASQIPITWGLGQIRGRHDYRADGKLLRKQESTFNYVKADYTNSRYRNFKIAVVKRLRAGGGDCALTLLLGPDGFVNREFTFKPGEYHGISGRIEKTKDRIVQYFDSGDSLVQEDYFTYNPEHLKLSSTYTFDSRGRRVEKRYYYPYDYSMNGTIGKLRDAGIIPIVSTETWLSSNSDTVLIDGAVTDFTELPNKVIVPYKEYEFESEQNVLRQSIGAFNPSVLVRNTNYFKEQSTVTKFDSKGNEVEIVDRGRKSVQLWGYNSLHLIANIRNAQESDVGYTSFENDGNVSWSISSAQRNTQEFVTGSKSYDLGNGVVTKNSLNPSKTYKITFWSKSSNVRVNGNGAIAGEMLRGWTYYEAFVSTASSITISTASGSALIDELRLYPEESSMTTYTYTPGVGVTSVADENSIVTYFIYDALKRLIYVRDKDGGIIQSHVYNYKKY